MPRLQKTCLAVTVVIVIGIAIVAYSNLRDRDTAEESNVVTIGEALSLYFKDNSRYPEDLDVLVEQYGLKQEQTQGYSYSPAYNYGSYGLGYTEETATEFRVMNLGGPPPTEMSHEALAADLVVELRMYYTGYGRYPDTLLELEIVYPKATERIEATRKEDFAYSVSEDKQSCSLDGRTIEPIPPLSPAKEKMIRDGKINYLTKILLKYREDNGRFPRTLQELVSSGYNGRHPITLHMDEFLKGEDFELREWRRSVFGWQENS
jgi:hypothetical protein